MSFQPNAWGGRGRRRGILATPVYAYFFEKKWRLLYCLNLSAGIVDDDAEAADLVAMVVETRSKSNATDGRLCVGQNFRTNRTTK